MLTFAIKSAIYISIMFIPYMLMLRNESFFRFNRVLLLCIMVLSLVLPLCDFHIMAFSNNPLQQGFIQVGLPVAIFDEKTETVMHSANQGMSWVTIVAYLYITGIIGTLLYKMFQMTQLYRAINNGVLWKEKKDGITIYCHANDIMPFSWFSAVVISEKDYNETGAEILSHEMGHVRCHHSWDILLANIVEIVQWFNPLSWILASSLRDVHEYEADEAVLTSGVNIKQYQMLLIRKAIGANSYAFANGFNHSLLKKRITKMLQPESNPWRRTKALYIIPVAVIALSAFATPELNNRVDAIADKAPSAIVGKGTVKSESSASVAQNDKIDLAEMAMVAAKDTVKNDAVWVVDGKVLSKQEREQLVTDVSEVSTIDVIRTPEIVRKYTNDPNVKMALLFTMRSKDEVKPAATADNNDAYDVVEQMPQFPGGQMEMMNFIAKNMKYPAEAASKNIQGRVIVQFVVDKDGSITDVKTTKSPDPILTEEAERLVRSMPNWTPGKQNGEAVRVRFFVPLQFALN